MGNSVVIPSFENWYIQPLKQLKITINTSLDAGTFFLVFDGKDSHDRNVIIKAYQYNEPLINLNIIKSSMQYFKALKKHLPEMQGIIRYSKVSILDNMAFLIRPQFDKELMLTEFISNRQPTLEPFEKLFLFYQIFSKLISLHSAGLAHGDLKPDNIFVSGQDLDVVIVDPAPFKPVQIQQSRLHLFYHFFTTNSNSGCYLAPERIVGIVHKQRKNRKHSIISNSSMDVFNFEENDDGTVEKDFEHDFEYDDSDESIDPNSIDLKMADVFSLGCIIAFIYLNGQHLFSMAKLHQYASDKYDIRQVLAPIKDKYIINIILGLVSVDIEERRSTMNSLTSFFGAFLPILSQMFYEYKNSNAFVSEPIKYMPYFEALINEHFPKGRILMFNFFADQILRMSNIQSIVFAVNELSQFVNVWTNSTNRENDDDVNSIQNKNMLHSSIQDSPNDKKSPSESSSFIISNSNSYILTNSNQTIEQNSNSSVFTNSNQPIQQNSYSSILKNESIQENPNNKSCSNSTVLFKSNTSNESNSVLENNDIKKKQKALIRSISHAPSNLINDSVAGSQVKHSSGNILPILQEESGLSTKKNSSIVRINPRDRNANERLKRRSVFTINPQIADSNLSAKFKLTRVIPLLLAIIQRTIPCVSIFRQASLGILNVFKTIEYIPPELDGYISMYIIPEYEKLLMNYQGEQYLVVLAELSPLFVYRLKRFLSDESLASLASTFSIIFGTNLASVSNSFSMSMIRLAHSIQDNNNQLSNCSKQIEHIDDYNLSSYESGYYIVSPFFLYILASFNEKDANAKQAILNVIYEFYLCSKYTRTERMMYQQIFSEYLFPLCVDLITHNNDDTVLNLFAFLAKLFQFNQTVESLSKTSMNPFDMFSYSFGYQFYQIAYEFLLKTKNPEMKYWLSKLISSFTNEIKDFMFSKFILTNSRLPLVNFNQISDSRKKLANNEIIYLNQSEYWIHGSIGYSTDSDNLNRDKMQPLIACDYYDDNFIAINRQQMKCFTPKFIASYHIESVSISNVLCTSDICIISEESNRIRILAVPLVLSEENVNKEIYIKDIEQFTEVRNHQFDDKISTINLMPIFSSNYGKTSCDSILLGYQRGTIESFNINTGTISQIFDGNFHQKSSRMSSNNTEITSIQPIFDECIVCSNNSGCVCVIDTRMPTPAQLLNFDFNEIADLCTWSGYEEFDKDEEMYRTRRGIMLGVGFQLGAVSLVDTRTWTSFSFSSLQTRLKKLIPINPHTDQISLQPSLPNSSITSNLSDVCYSVSSSFLVLDDQSSFVDIYREPSNEIVLTYDCNYGHHNKTQNFIRTAVPYHGGAVVIDDISASFLTLNQNTAPISNCYNEVTNEHCNSKYSGKLKSFRFYDSYSTSLKSNNKDLQDICVNSSMSISDESSDTKINLFSKPNKNSGEMSKSIHNHTGKVTSAAQYKNYIISSDDMGFINLWKISS